jgi:hypothetical protein
MIALAAALCIIPAAHAAAASERWEQAETEHFLFIFEPRDREIVNELLTLCEPVYARVCGFFHSYPKKVPCIIRSRARPLGSTRSGREPACRCSRPLASPQAGGVVESGRCPEK